MIKIALKESISIPNYSAETIDNVNTIQPVSYKVSLSIFGYKIEQ